ncbi:MAG: sigma-70 family RNA polymerase sigma factor [Clostridia bacterium]|nr:sigma-70 family RNA polymerase sigma factor [Clostridia bacterium]
MIYSEKNDAMLVTLTLTGDQSAYEALVIRWQKAVLASANAITRNHYMAEDAAQDAFVSAWMKLDSLREADKFGAWVCRIAKNRAKNIVSRYREWVSLDDLLNLDETAERFPEELIGVTDPHEALHDSIGALPEKVRQVIHLHYFEGYSIAEIADRLREPIGTVKWRLSEGRRIIRKDLGAVNERIDDTLVEKVMKRVAELKLWRLKNDTAGFEAAYREVLAAVEELPESKEKYHAMADVLQLGWWWLPGAKNDALRARIKEAAEKGGNLDVLCNIIHGESDKLSGKDKIEFIRDKQIPLLEQIGYPQGLAEEWFWLGCTYRDNDQIDEALDCYRKVLEIAPPSYVYYGNAKAAIECETWARDKDYDKLSFAADGEEYRIIDGATRFWSQPGYSRGNAGSVDAGHLYYYASRCDHYFIDPAMKLGEVKLSSDGVSTLTFAADDVTIETPCGRFENCQKWITHYENRWQGNLTTAYYKDGVGMVRYEQQTNEEFEAYLLSEYNINGGEGVFPLATGNYWCYEKEGENPNYSIHFDKYEVTGSKDNRFVLSSIHTAQRLEWDDRNWSETMLRIRDGYATRISDQEWRLSDVRPLMEQAERLASTDYEKVHTRVANKVMRRILDTDTNFTPDATELGRWNFFQNSTVCKKRGELTLSEPGRRRYSFEWKNYCNSEHYPLLMNFMYDLINDNIGCVWSDDWTPGMVTTLKLTRFRKELTIDLAISDVGTITTPAGTFDNCLSVALNIKGLDGGLAYQGDHKTFYYAPSVGIVRMDSADAEGKLNARYDLTAYEGVGAADEYFPIFDGLFRRYDAQGMPDHLIGAVEYTCVTSPKGSLVLFADQIGVEKINK